MTSKIKIRNGMLFVDGMPLGRVQGRRIRIKDRCKRRSLKRGSDTVEFDILELIRAIKQ